MSISGLVDELYCPLGGIINILHSLLAKQKLNELHTIYLWICDLKNKNGLIVNLSVDQQTDTLWSVEICRNSAILAPASIRLIF